MSGRATLTMNRSRLASTMPAQTIARTWPGLNPAPLWLPAQARPSPPTRETRCRRPAPLVPAAGRDCAAAARAPGLAACLARPGLAPMSIHCSGGHWQSGLLPARRRMGCASGLGSRYQCNLMGFAGFLRFGNTLRKSKSKVQYDKIHRSTFWWVS